MDIMELACPRPPLRLIESHGVRRLTLRRAPHSDDDVTEHFLLKLGRAALPPADGFVLKSKSPSCGVGDARVYTADPTPPSTGERGGEFTNSNGVFVDECVAKASKAAVVTTERKILAPDGVEVGRGGIRVCSGIGTFLAEAHTSCR
jgi:uncharacterized protein YbbK (DUF523 family)